MFTAKAASGLQFEAWPMIESTLSRRRDFTRRFANHKDTSGGFYEKQRGAAILHFLFQEGDRAAGTCISIFTVRFTRRAAPGDTCVTSCWAK